MMKRFFLLLLALCLCVQTVQAESVPQQDEIDAALIRVFQQTSPFDGSLKAHEVSLKVWFSTLNKNSACQAATSFSRLGYVWTEYVASSDHTPNPAQNWHMYLVHDPASEQVMAYVFCFDALDLNNPNSVDNPHFMDVFRESAVSGEFGQDDEGLHYVGRYLQDSNYMSKRAETNDQLSAADSESVFSKITEQGFQTGTFFFGDYGLTMISYGTNSGTACWFVYHKAAQTSADTWVCQNGHPGNTGKFCTECGAPKPTPTPTSTPTPTPTPSPTPSPAPHDDGWVCENGHGGNMGKFCSECGAPKPLPTEENQPWTCENGHGENTGKFCMECGAPKPGQDITVTQMPKQREDGHLLGLRYDKASGRWDLRIDGEDIRFTTQAEVIEQIEKALGITFDEFETNLHWAWYPGDQPIYLEGLPRVQDITSIVSMNSGADWMNIRFSMEYDLQELPEKMLQDIEAIVSLCAKQYGSLGRVVALFDSIDYTSQDFDSSAFSPNFAELIPEKRSQSSWITFDGLINEVTLNIYSFSMTLSVHIPLETQPQK